MEETMVMEHEEDLDNELDEELDTDPTSGSLVPIGELSPAEIKEAAIAVLPEGSEEAQWDRIMRFAQFAAATKLYGEDSEWDLAMKGLVGMGLGLHVATSFQALEKIGKGISIPAKLQRALARRAGYRIRQVELTEKVCTLQLIVEATGELVGEETFTWEDAGKAKLLGNEVWHKHPKRMLLARCSDHLISTFAPEVLYFRYGDPI